MPEHAATPLSSDPTVSLSSLIANGIDPAVAEPLQALIQTLVRTETARCLQAQRLTLEAELAVRVETELATRARQLEATYDQRVAQGVADKVRQIIEQNRLARHRQFGPSSEAGQGGLFNEAELLASQPEPTDDDTPAAKPDTRRSTGPSPAKARGHRRALPAELPRVEVIIDVPPAQRQDANGTPMVRIGQEVSEQLDIIPMKIRVIRTIRPKYAPANGRGVPLVACVAPSIVPRSNFTAGALAMLLTVKYADGLPLNRFAKVLARHGVDVARQSLARVAIQTAQALQPIANLMRDALLDSPIIGMDETTVQVLKEPGRAASTKSYMWVQRGGPPGQPVVLFDYAPTRAGAVASRLLEGWRGYLMTDGYTGYNAVAATPGVTHLACMAHARRKFVEARRASPKGCNSHAEKALTFFARLYRIEKRVRNAPDELRHRVRQKLSKQTLDALHVWLIDMLPKVPPKSKLGQALAYLHNLWDKLVRYIDRADLPIDNNACENAIRPFVIGRKNWLFSHTPAGAQASALVYSLIETAKACGREPYAWLCYVLERLPLARTVDDIDALLPWNTHDHDLAMNLLAREQWT